MQDLVNSPLVYEKITNIGEKYDLNIDKIGELDAETRDVLSGVTPAGDYVKNITDRLEISRDTAQQIADEVGTEVFTNLRTAMREMQEKKDAAAESTAMQSRHDEQNKTLAEFEKEGNLNMEKEPETLEHPINITRGEGNADLIINQIENPETANTTPINILDHMLAGPTSQPTKTETVVAPAPSAPSAPTANTRPSPTQTPAQKSRPYSTDPYREPII